MYLRRDLHAGTEGVLDAVDDELLCFEVDQCAIGVGLTVGGFGAGWGGCACALLVRVGGVCAEVGDFALHHAVFLKLVGGEFDFGGLSLVDEADILIGYPHFGSEDLVFGYERHEDGAGADDGADGVGGDVFDDAVLRGFEFE